MQPKRIQLSRRKGYKMPPNSVKVARPTKWGNPFKLGIHGDAKMCVELFKSDIGWINSRLGFDYDDIATLKGKNLACFCPLHSPCHADVLLEIANQ